MECCDLPTSSRVSGNAAEWHLWLSPGLGLLAHPLNGNGAACHHHGSVGKRKNWRINAPNDAHDRTGDEIADSIHAARHAIGDSALANFRDKIRGHRSF